MTSATEEQITKSGAPLCPRCGQYAVTQGAQSCLTCADDWFAEIVQYADKPVIRTDDITVTDVIGSLPAIERHFRQLPGVRKVTLTPVGWAEDYRVEEAKRL